MKTGTTAIQEILAKHDDSILLYPKIGLFRNAHHHLVFNYLGRKRPPPGCPKYAKGELLDAFATCTQRSGLDILISSEWLGTHAEHPGAPSFIRELATRVAAGPPDVEILVACREHFDRAASLYGQKQKKGSHSTPDEFIKQNAISLCYAPVISNLQQTGFRVVALNYHPAREWVRRFLTYIGFPTEEIPLPSTANQSFAPWVLIARMASNKVLVADDRPTEILKHKIIRRLARSSDAHSSSQFIFSRDVATDLESTFAEDRKYLARAFQIELPTPRLSSLENMFFMDAATFKEIEYALEDAGSQGKHILEIASKYVRA
jgi:hypothetical protein